jgi:hypothetical protein
MSQDVEPAQVEPAQVESSREPALIDPRGPQFNAGLTSVVLIAVLLTAPGVAGVVLLALQAALFASGALLGVQRTPAAWLFRASVRPRLAPPAHLEDPRPPRFAQALGLAFALVGLAGYLTGIDVVGAVATGLALVAALLNALFGFCLGCELYLLGRRLTTRSTAADHRQHTTTEKEETSA